MRACMRVGVSVRARGVWGLGYLEPISDSTSHKYPMRQFLSLLLPRCAMGGGCRRLELIHATGGETRWLGAERKQRPSHGFEITTSEHTYLGILLARLIIVCICTEITLANTWPKKAVTPKSNHRTRPKCSQTVPWALRDPHSGRRSRATRILHFVCSQSATIAVA